MKRLLFILVCSLVFCASYSQGLGEPLKKDITQFMGIPIDGSVSLMTDRLKIKDLFLLMKVYSDYLMENTFLLI